MLNDLLFFSCILQCPSCEPSRNIVFISRERCQHAYKHLRETTVVTVITVAIPSTFLMSLLLWFVRAFVSSIICLVIGILAIHTLSHITTKISEFQTIKGDPVATGLFVSGFLVFAGLVVYGSMVNPFFLGQGVLIGSYFNFQRLLVVALSFFVSARAHDLVR